jgi:sodium pump decarboxylase gamma subunit
MTEQMSRGIELMIVGMGIVFLFLIMLVVAINLMSALVQRYFPMHRHTAAASVTRRYDKTSPPLLQRTSPSIPAKASFIFDKWLVCPFI